MPDSPSIDGLFPKRTLARAEGPLYRQLADILRRPIAEGSLAIGEELPKEASIADHFGVSLITVRQALRDLEADGLIRKRSAKPAVVAAREATSGAGWHFGNFADMAAFTRDAALRVRSWRKESSTVLERHFGMAKGEAGWCLRSLLAVGPERKAHITTFFPPDIGRQLKKDDFSDVLIFRTLQARLGLDLAVAHVTVRAEIADEALADALAIASGAPLLTVEMLYQASDGRNVEFSIARHPADRFSISYDAPNDLG